MKRRVFATLSAALAAILLTTAAVAAQVTPPTPAQPPAAPAPIYQTPVDAQTTRDQLHEILRQYPPSVGEVLGRDHSLLSRPDYLAPYPQLVAFVQQHPEVARNPSFFFGDYHYYQRQQVSPELEALGSLLGGMAVFLAVGLFLGVMTWLIRAVIQHRRWLRLSKVQAEVHVKLMDRMATNEELLAYIQSPAGRRFLESSPIPQEADSPRLGAPVGPIIWSLMAGIVLATVGIGFRLAANAVAVEAQQAFTVVGLILLALGVGFVVASGMAYLVSARLGLFPARAADADASGHA
ncbi:MAG: hypothetical protein AB7N29_17610 [Vicinamibacterales bacterium]